jgi:hypothetical protein
LPLEPREYWSVVPAGFEPATSAKSEWRALQAAPRNHVNQSGRQESNPPQTVHQTVALPLGPRPDEKVSSGSRTRLSDLGSRCLSCSATDTNQFRRLDLNQQPSRLRRDALPLSYTGKNQSQRWDSNPLPPLYGSGTRPVENRRLDAGWPVGVEATTDWLTTSSPIHLSSATVLRPGIEPGTRPSQSRTMSLSPSKQFKQYPDHESNLDLDLRTVT